MNKEISLIEYTSLVQHYFNSAEPVCYSGGADGADFYWSASAIRANHNVLNFNFKGHKTNVLKDTVVCLSDEVLNIANNYVKDASKILNRHLNKDKTFIYNLLRRNYFQINYTQAVYAVGRIKSDKAFVENGITHSDKMQVDGGTAWACQMYNTLKSESYLIFYCQKRKKSYIWDNISMIWKQIHIDDIKKPGIDYKKYTGIGSRELEDCGKYFIMDLIQV